MGRREHAIITRKVVNTDNAGKTFIRCAWDDCEKPGYQLHLVRVDYGAPGVPHVLNYVFCSDRHKMYFVHSHRAYGRLPPGWKMSVI
jgi:hypothetical protein